MYTKSLIPHSRTPVMFVLYCSYWSSSLSADKELGVLRKGHCAVTVPWAGTVPALGSPCSSVGELPWDSGVLVFLSATLKLMKMCICKDKAEILVCSLCFHCWFYNL